MRVINTIIKNCKHVIKITHVQLIPQNNIFRLKQPIFKDPCKFCHGSGVLKCLECDGVGFYIYTPSFYGSTKCKCNYGSKKCNFCDGSGESYLTY